MFFCAWVTLVCVADCERETQYSYVVCLCFRVFLYECLGFLEPKYYEIKAKPQPKNEEKQNKRQTQFLRACLAVRFKPTTTPPLLYCPFPSMRWLMILANLCTKKGRLSHTKVTGVCRHIITFRSIHQTCRTHAAVGLRLQISESPSSEELLSLTQLLSLTR